MTVATTGRQTFKHFEATRFEWKNADEGTFRAYFSTFNDIDKDRDVTLPGAFTEGQEVRIAQWGHNWDYPPVGKGTIHADAKEAWCDGQFFLDTAAGLDTYRVVKNLGALQEWSYGFEILEKGYGAFKGEQVRFLKKNNVIEVSPVMVGAGNGTHTGDIKSRYRAKWDTGSDSYEQLTEELEAAIKTLLTNPLGGMSGYCDVLETYADHVIIRLCTDPWYWDDDVDDTCFYDIPYTVAADGSITLGPPAEVERTWQAVPADTGMEAAGDTAPRVTKTEGRRLTTPTRPFKADVTSALTAAAHVATRARSFAGLRAKEGRAISSARMEQMGQISGALRESADNLDAILTEAMPPPKSAPPPAAPVLYDGYAEVLRFQALMAGKHY